MKITEIQSRVEKEREEETRHFINKIAFNLPPSNETMEVIRLLRKELPSFLASQLLLIAQETYKACRPEEKAPRPNGNYEDDAVTYGYNQALKDLDANYQKLMGVGK